jgi:hypothetical protein
MSSWQIVRIAAGTFVLLSLLLAVPGRPAFVGLVLSSLLAAKLLQSGLTESGWVEPKLRTLGTKGGF